MENNFVNFWNLELGAMGLDESDSSSPKLEAPGRILIRSYSSLVVQNILKVIFMLTQHENFREDVLRKPLLQSFDFLGI